MIPHNKRATCACDIYDGQDARLRDKPKSAKNPRLPDSVESLRIWRSSAELDRFRSELVATAQNSLKSRGSDVLATSGHLWPKRCQQRRKCALPRETPPAGRDDTKHDVLRNSQAQGQGTRAHTNALLAAWPQIRRGDSAHCNDTCVWNAMVPAQRMCADADTIDATHADRDRATSGHKAEPAAAKQTQEHRPISHALHDSWSLPSRCWLPLHLGFNTRGLRFPPHLSECM